MESEQNSDTHKNDDDVLLFLMIDKNEAEKLKKNMEIKTIYYPCNAVFLGFLSTFGVWKVKNCVFGLLEKL
jgi:hypothetical protein